MRPFPAGLMTDVGMLVANAAYARRPSSLRSRATPTMVLSFGPGSRLCSLPGSSASLRDAILRPPIAPSWNGAQATLWTHIRATSADEQFGALVLGICQRALSSGALWCFGRRRRRVQRGATLEHCLPRRSPPRQGSVDVPGHHSALLLGEEAVDRQDDDRQWTFSRHVAPASDEWDREASLFALADGMLGVRGGIEECQPSGGGVFHARSSTRTPIDYHERFSGFAIGHRHAPARRRRFNDRPPAWR